MRTVPGAETEQLSPSRNHSGGMFQMLTQSLPRSRALRAGAGAPLRGGGEGGGVQDGDTCAPMADACRCSAETTTVSQGN